MSFLNTKSEKKSFTLSSFLLALIIFLMFYLGLSYTDVPLEERGISINFGNTDSGRGNIQSLTKPAAAVKMQQVEVVRDEVVKEEKIPSAVQEKVEDVLTEETEDVPVIIPEKVIPKKEVKVVEKPAEAEKPVEAPKKPSKSTTDALSNIINGSKTSDGSETINEGNDTKNGDKGDINGDPYATSYYGSPGTGLGSSGYGLNGRKLLSNGKVQQQCNESGTVVVKIEVDKNGNVIAATPGVKGTTNNDPCLLKPAKETAFMHKWNLDSNAPSRQIGFVVVNFKLGE